MRNKFTSMYALKQNNAMCTFYTQSWIYAGVTSWFSKNNQLAELEFTNEWMDPIAYDVQDDCSSNVLGNVYEGHVDYWLREKFKTDNKIVITSHEHLKTHSTGMISLGFDHWDIHTLNEFSNPILYHEINRSSVSTAEYDLVMPVGRPRRHRYDFLKMLNNSQHGLTIVTDNRQSIIQTDLKFYELGIEIYFNKFNIKTPADIFNSLGVSKRHQYSFYDQHTGRSIDHLPHKRMHAISRVNLVLETTVEDLGSVYLTEKTYKVLANHRPFIILGDTHALEKLKQQGFKTFGQFCDESYDQESDLNKRMSKVIEACKQLNQSAKQYPAEIDAICRHNQEKFFNRQRHNENLAQFGKLCLDTIYN